MKNARFSYLLSLIFCTLTSLSADGTTSKIKPQIERNLLIAGGQLCQRVVGNMLGPPVFLAGITRAVTWYSSGPIEGTFRRRGTGRSPYGPIDITVAREFERVIEFGERYYVPKRDQGWGEVVIHIDLEETNPQLPSLVFGNSSGISVDRSATTLDIKIRASSLPQGLDFHDVTAQMLSRIFHPPTQEN